MSLSLSPRLALPQQTVLLRRHSNLSRKTVQPQGVSPILSKIQYPSNYRINSKKTFHSSKKGRRVVAGLTLTQDGNVSIGRSQKRYVRSLIHQYEKLGEPDRQRLVGYLAYIRSVEPECLNRLVLKFGSEKISAVRAGAIKSS